MKCTSLKDLKHAASAVGLEVTTQTEGAKAWYSICDAAHQPLFCSFSVQAGFDFIEDNCADQLYGLT